MADDGFASREEFSRGDEDIFTLIDKPGYRQRRTPRKKQELSISASEDLFAVVPDLLAGVAALPAVPGHILPTSGNGVAGNFLIPTDMPEMVGSRSEKITGNIEAIVLAQRLTREGRGASRDEQTILARYVGWGGLRGVFDPRETGAATANGKAQARLRELLTPEEYRAAAGSTEDAFFTGRTVVAAMWAKMRDFGFTGGRALEPSAGIGAFLGNQPADLAEQTEWYASELDKVSSMIAGLLYPDAVLRAGEGFEAARFRLGSMDIAIGNPPYSARTMQSDLHTDIPPFSVHNFMVAKSAMLLREGGIMGFVVTHRFMDRMTAEARSFFARHLNFLGAVRLPDTVFADAGTRVTTDIVFFQKRAEGKPEGDLSWLMTDVPFGSLKVNGYFAKHPDMMLGRPAMDGHRYSANAEAVFALHDDGRDLGAALAGALAKITGMLPPPAVEMVTALLPDRTESDLAIGESILLDDGRIMMRGDDDAAGNSIVTEVTPKTILGARTPRYLEVVKAARALEAAKATPEAREASEDALQEAITAARVYRRDGAEDPAPSTMAKLIYTIDPKNDQWTGNLSKTAGELEDQIQKTALGASRFARLKAILSLRRNTQALIRAEYAGQRDMEKKRIALRQQYRTFVKSYGYLSKPVNDRLIDGKPGAEAALEIDYKPANKARGIAETAKEATILHKRVILPPPSVTSASSPEDGVHISMRDKGRLDLAYVAQLTGRSIEDVTEHLTRGTDPMVFFDPEKGAYVLADEYLSGNIAQKIKQARKAKQLGNIRHLEDAMPAPKVQAQIIPTIRSLWLPESVFRDFLAALGDREAQVTVKMAVGKIFVNQSYGAQASDNAKQFATARKTAFDIFRAASSGTTIVIYDKVDDSFVKNERETQFANSAVERMADEFSRWAYVNPERADRIVAAFNEKVNVVRTRNYSGTKYFRQVGADPGIALRTNQKDGAWRMMVSQSTLLHHAVGVGKTYTAISAIMERKRLGLSNKAAVAVPKHVLSQWARSWYALYPAANILVADERDFNAENRRKMIARIATGDYDGILIGHTSLKFIENEPTDVVEIINNQIEEFEEAAEEAKRNGESGRTVAAIAKRAEKLHERLTEMEKNISRDRMGFSFIETGIDYLVVDESQEYKNLEYSTASRQLVGMNNPIGSQRAFDMFIKVRGLLSRGLGVAFLSGTPISNSLVEIYVIMKYLAYDTLKEMGLLHYDAWASTFVEAKIRFEYTATGRVMERNVLSGLINLGPLSETYKSFADIILRKDMIRLYEEQIAQENRRDGTSRSTRFPVPRISGGGRQLITIPPSPDHEEYTSYLVRRMNGIKRNTGFKPTFPK